MTQEELDRMNRGNSIKKQLEFVAFAQKAFEDSLKNGDLLKNPYTSIAINISNAKLHSTRSINLLPHHIEHSLLEKGVVRMLKFIKRELEKEFEQL